MRLQGLPDGRRRREHSAGWLDKVGNVPCLFFFFFFVGNKVWQRKERFLEEDTLFDENDSAREIWILTSIVRI